MRLFRGNVPEGSEWVLVGRWEGEGEEWIVYARPQAHTADWMTYKVVAAKPVENKANYWFVRNRKTKATGYSRDLMHMEEHRPELLAALKEML